MCFKFFIIFLIIQFFHLNFIKFFFLFKIILNLKLLLLYTYSFCFVNFIFILKYLHLIMPQRSYGFRFYCSSPFSLTFVMPIQVFFGRSVALLHTFTKYISIYFRFYFFLLVTFCF